MSFLSPFFTETCHQNDCEKMICISAQQGNDFAKHIADDFNPIHDTDSKRFCVPGDLLFAIALEKYGIHQKMEFRFKELVKADIGLIYGPLSDTVDVVNERDKSVLEVQLNGEQSLDSQKVEQLVRNYVVFSGKNFPGILVPLMQEYQVMINPARPLVIYESMSLHFDTLEFSDLRIELAATSLEVFGKRGSAELNFSLYDNDIQIGKGLKKLVLSGLRPYEQDAVDSMCEQYSISKKVAGSS